MAGLAFLLYRALKRQLVEVEISDKNIILLSKNLEVSWFDVEGIRFNALGFYVLDLKDATYIFPPYGISIHILGFQINQSEMDVLIEKKKVKLKI